MKKSHTSRKTQSPLAITHVHDAAAGPSPAKGTIRHISTKHVSAGVPSMRAAPAAAGTEDESCASQPVQKLSQGLALIRLPSDTSTMSYTRSTSIAAGFGNVAEAAISSCVVHAYVMCPAGLPAEAPPAKPTSKPKAKKPHPPALSTHDLGVQDFDSAGINAEALWGLLATFEATTGTALQSCRVQEC
jgi:hypothetical protein